MATTVWVDGHVAADAVVPALDHGLTVGDGVFETCKVVHARPFAITRHLRRLERSAAVLGLRLPPDHEIRSAVDATLAAAGPMAFGRLRITVTGGAGPLGSDRADAVPRLVVATAPSAPWPARIRVITVDWTRNERSAIAGAKTTSYAENVVALAAAARRGAHEALLANTVGQLCEGTGSNVAIVIDGQVLTPTLASGCLAGITRELMLEWARDEGLDVIEKDVPFEALDDADDVLLTSSTRDVQHVSAVDGREVAASEAGRGLGAMFARRAGAEVDP